MKHETKDYVTQVLVSAHEVNATQWNELLNMQTESTAFMRHEYLLALQTSGSATPETGWTSRFITLEHKGVMAAACVVYLKTHSYGEYVFDQAWANAYAQHGLNYYPKAVVAVPFTPVPGSRLLARTRLERSLLIKTLIQWSKTEQVSSLHVLFGGRDDLQSCQEAGLMLRHSVQFHWRNVTPTLATSCDALPPEGAHFALGRPGGEILAPTLATARMYRDFEDFLASLSQDKRKKIRQERRKVADAGVGFRHAVGIAITEHDWDFFYHCYQRTYLEHGNAPYLSRDFFHRMAKTMPENWLLFVAERQGRAIAASLIALDTRRTGSVAYGRYWGALERVDCLHFEACYYQPLQWCIANGYQRFEGGAQGEHKMARALLPVKTGSAHWIADASFAAAVERFLKREGQGIVEYLDDLEQRNPLRRQSG